MLYARRKTRMKVIMFYWEAKKSSNNDSIIDTDFTNGKGKYKQIQAHSLIP